MTEVADTLVREEGLSFRQAHETVGTMVQAVVDDGRDADSIALADLDAAAEAVLGRETSLSAEALRDALDPVVNVERRDLPGGTAPERNREDLERQRERLGEELDWIDEATGRIADAADERRRLSEAYVDG